MAGEKQKQEKMEEKTEKKGEKPKVEKKEEEKIKVAFAKGINLSISIKYAIAICSFIRKRNPNESTEKLNLVIKKKVAIPIKGELPHRKNMPKGKPSGRYPIKASKEFIKLLTNLIANASVKGMDLENLIITKAIANKASTPVRGSRIGFGRKKFKRTHVYLEALESKKSVKSKRNKKEKTQTKK